MQPPFSILGLDLKFLIAAAVGWFLKILFDQQRRLIERQFRITRLLRKFQKMARQSIPKPYVDVTTTVKNGDKETSFQNFQALADYLSTQVNSG